MAKAEIFAGVCGFSTTVETSMNGRVCRLNIVSECKSVRGLAVELTEVDPYKEISNRPAMPHTLQLGVKHCPHAACPVPVGIIKAIEVEAKLAAPADVTIKISK
ncbi:MAG: hypothetical protein AAGU11_03385 [Syntrophobacteraceae bacterium]